MVFQIRNMIIYISLGHSTGEKANWKVSAIVKAHTWNVIVIVGEYCVFYN